MHVLVCLAARAGKVVTREELLDAVNRTELDSPQKSSIQQVLDFCDESRFAGKETDRDARAQMLQRVKELHTANQDLQDLEE